MKKILNLKVFVSLALIVIGGFWLHLANQISTKGAADQSTWGTLATLPRFILILFLVCNALTLLSEVRGALKNEEEPMDEQDKQSLKIAVLMMVIIFAYGFLIDIFGYIICNIALLLVALLVFGERKKARLILVPVCVTVFLYVVFRYLLEVSLPGISFL